MSSFNSPDFQAVTFPMVIVQVVFVVTSGTGSPSPTKIFARDESDGPSPVAASRLHAQKIVLK